MKINELKDCNKFLSQKISQLNLEFDELKKKVMAMEKDWQRKESNFKKIIEELKEINVNLALQLKKDNENLKATNNCLNSKLISSNSKMKN